MIAATKSANASGTTEANAEESKKSVSSVSIAERTGKHRKRLAMLRARAALAGVILYATDGDHGRAAFIVSRWALTRQLDSLDAVEAWLNFVTGAQA